MDQNNLVLIKQQAKFKNIAQDINSERSVAYPWIE